MLTWNDNLQFDFSDSMVNHLFTEKTLFFDIETTGFSREHSTVYLIGCAFRKSDVCHTEQFFAETPEQQKEVLAAFAQILAGYDTIVTFNGESFDIPFINSKYQALFQDTKDLFAGKHSIDIFKAANHLKPLLSLCDYRQKTIENFLGIYREDVYTGKELIAVYQDYVKAPSAEAYSLLRLHNYEDVIHMPYMLSVFAYQSFLDGNFTITSIAANEYKNGKELFCTLQLFAQVPKQIACLYDGFYLTMKGDTAQLRIPLLEGELKYFFPDYGNYYYLPAEDIAVHKSIAASVERQHRKKATANTCYTKKYGIFLPQYKELHTPVFKQERKDKKAYFELAEQFILSEIAQKEYILHILQYLMAYRK